MTRKLDFFDSSLGSKREAHSDSRNGKMCACVFWRVYIIEATRKVNRNYVFQFHYACVFIFADDCNINSIPLV